MNHVDIARGRYGSRSNSEDGERTLHSDWFVFVLTSEIYITEGSFSSIIFNWEGAASNGLGLI